MASIVGVHGLKITGPERRRLQYIQQAVTDPRPLYNDPARQQARKTTKTSAQLWTPVTGKVMEDTGRRLKGYITGPSGNLDFGQLVQASLDNGGNGIEATTWGNGGLDPVLGAANPDYGQAIKDFLLREAGPDFKIHAVSGHLVGGGITHRLTKRLRNLMPPDIAIIEDKKEFREACKHRLVEIAITAHNVGAPVVTGFLGGGNPTEAKHSEDSIWDVVNYDFPPKDIQELLLLYLLFGREVIPVLDQFQEIGPDGMRFAMEKHPTESALGIDEGDALMAALGDHDMFGWNYDPSHQVWRQVDYIEDIRVNRDRILHAHAKDAITASGLTSSGSGRFKPWTSTANWWRFITNGEGKVDFDAINRAFNEIGYAGPISTEHEKDTALFLPELAKGMRHANLMDFLPGPPFEASMQEASAGGKQEVRTVAEIIGFKSNYVSVASLGIPVADSAKDSNS